MAMAHVCLGCGLDLARVRPAREPRYGLLLVVCPRCDRAGTRTRPPLLLSWRRWQRLNRTLGLLSLQLLAIIVLAALHMIMVRELAVVRVEGVSRWTLVQGLTISLAVGTWLTAGLAHWRRLLSFLAWATLIATLLLCRPILRPLVSSAAGETRVIDLGRWGLELLVLAGSMIVAIAGIPLGRTARGIIEQGTRWRRGRLRRRMQRRRRT